MVLEEEEEERRRRSARRTLQWSTWSTTIACGSASGTQLASNIAGGWPLPMGPRLVMPSGGRRGSSAEGQDDVLGDSGYMVCVSSCAHAVFFFFYVMENSDPEVVGPALWRVGYHAEWRSAHSRPSAAFLVFALGIWTLRHELLVSGSSCSLFGVCAMLGSTKGTCSASPGWLLEVFYDFLRDWVDSAPEVDSPVLTGDAPVARLLSLEIWVFFLRASCVFSLISVR